jgi:polyhydroxyalkanoate synthase subunit PhaC
MDDFSQAWWNWYQNLARDPAQQHALIQNAADRVADSWSFAARAAAGQPLAPATKDPQFADPLWHQWPFNVYAHNYQNFASWWRDALEAVPANDDKEKLRLNFLADQALAAASPANYLPTNPQLIEHTRAEGGANLLRGTKHLLEDAQRMLDKTPPPGTEKFRVGEDVAATPGTVIYQNNLIELIQYSPQTPSVHAEPILIVPAWIMKYYILDLSPRNSLIRYLVQQGHTVFAISWKNPNAADRDLGMDDYVRSGLFAALDSISNVVPNHGVHVVGYCIGGTLLSIGAAVLAARGDTRIKSLTLLAAQTDFSEPGELAVFISQQQLAGIDLLMQQQGVLDSAQMGAAFMMLRADDLLWAPAINTYIRGQRDEPNDLMAWNADGTRMPFRMHSDYLARLYLKNELAQGKFTFEGQPVDLSAIKVPMFVVGTETDHVAPWHSTFKTAGLVRSNDYTFLLTSGGHNAGIVSGPSHPRRRHRTLQVDDSTQLGSPEDYERNAVANQGSWWPTWAQWLVAHSSPEQRTPPPLGNPTAGLKALRPAPGEYVLG